MEHMTYNEVKTELIFASYEGVKEGCRLLIRNFDSTHKKLQLFKFQVLLCLKRGNIIKIYSGRVNLRKLSSAEIEYLQHHHMDLPLLRSLHTPSTGYMPL